MVTQARSLLVLLLAATVARQSFGQTVPAAGGNGGGGVVLATGSASQDATMSPERTVLTNYYRLGGPPPTPQPSLPPDPWGPERFQQPTPNQQHGYAGVSPLALNTNPTPDSLGIRLDTAYGLLREFDFGVFDSEHQVVANAGVTLLPFQAPCWLIGAKITGNYIGNMSMMEDTGGFSGDLFAGTRYKTVYLKIGPFWDYQNTVSKAGVAFAMLTNSPFMKDITVDSAFGWGIGNDQIGPETYNKPPFRLRRAEIADFDGQLRVGKFFTEYFQFGFTGNYYQFQYTAEEWGCGAFANIYVGRYIWGLDLTGGDEGLRGFVTLAFSWGKRTCEHPQDCKHIPLDTVGWVTRAVNRDPSVRIRSSWTGPLPPE